jgi:uncharacterized protein (TIGR02996 family)
MSEAGRLLQGVLDEPGDHAQKLVLADWLEERGDEASLARAALMRLHALRSRTRRRMTHAELDDEAEDLLRRRPDLLGPLANLRGAIPPLSVPLLPLFLVAPLTEVHDGPLATGSAWEGQLDQHPFSFPMTFQVRYRRGNLFSGEMQQDFQPLLRRPAEGRFFFQGVIFGRGTMAFVTHRAEGYGGYPGLYELSLKRAGWLIGSWWLPEEERRGQLRLRRRPA